MQKNITNFYNKTIWVNKKTIISADLLNKMEDKLLDLDLNIANKTELHDTQIGKYTTWSSDKISTWSMEQDGLFWVEKEDNFISADNTYEYKLKEIEIFGDTWQDKDSKNLFDINSLQMIGVNAEKGIINTEDNSITFNYENVKDYGCETNFIFEGGKKYKISADVEYNNSNYRARLICIGPVGLGFEWNNDLLNLMANKANFSERRFAVSAVIPNDGKQYALYLNGTNYEYNITGNTIFKNIVIEEVDDKTDTTKVTEYIPYHKADLSNIQHAGELYVDEYGEPKLDDQDRKQYKFEIETVNKNIVKPNMEMVRGHYNDNGIYDDNSNNMNSTDRITKKFISVDSGGRYSYKSTSDVEPLWLRVACFDVNHKLLGLPILGKKNGTFDMPENTKFIRIQHLNGDNISTSDLIIIKSDIVITEDIQHKSHKETILLPCQLMKVGDIKDRLFWDESKGKYIVEKVFDKYFMTGKEIYDVYEDDVNTDYCRAWFNTKDYKLNMLNCGMDGKGVIANGFEPRDWNHQKGGYISVAPFADSRIYFSFKDDMLEAQNRDAANKYFMENPTYILYPKATPELIETNITEPLYLPTYNNKTHVYHINDNNAKATIKAKFPLKTASAVANLSLENTKNSKDILDIKELNVNMLATNFDMDYRLLELEWALEDAGIAGINLLNTLNIDTKNNNKTLTRYEQAKIIITKQAYEYEILAKQLSRYLEKDIITQDKYNELIALMAENE